MNNNNKHIAKRRAGFAGLLLAVALTVVGASPSSAAETYSVKSGDYLTTRSFDYQPTYQDLATARISRVGITPIPIP